MKGIIKIGEKAEDFELKDQHGNTFKLSQQRGKKVLLSFHPLAWTPICETQMKDLEANYGRFLELNTVPVGISVDSLYCKKAWADAMGIKNTGLLADFWPHGEVAKKFGVFSQEEGFSKRVKIIIDEEGKVIFVKKYPISQAPDIREILDFLEKNR